MLAVFSDLDGSLKDNRQNIPQTNLDTLTELGRLGIVRVLATGRSLYSARKVIAPDFPIDYLVFSSGAGIMDWQNQKLLCSHHLYEDCTVEITSFLKDNSLDFMLHGSIPDNHHFVYHQHTQNNHDFKRRLDLYADFSLPMNWQQRYGPCSECIVIVSAEKTEEIYGILKQNLPQFSIIRATSPLDQQSGWLEIFPTQVSKSQAAEWLTAHLGISGHMAFGNDYNDLDLLHWTDQAFVVIEAPEELLSLFQVVGTAASGAFADAVKIWLQRLKL